MSRQKSFQTEFSTGCNQVFQFSHFSSFSFHEGHPGAALYILFNKISKLFVETTSDRGPLQGAKPLVGFLQNSVQKTLQSNEFREILYKALLSIANFVKLFTELCRVC
jgi:hypothetical protein